MLASNLLKIVVAFAAGIVVALGSALIYIRLNETPKYPAPSIMVPAAATADEPPAEKDATPDIQSPSPRPAEVPNPPVQKSTANTPVNKARTKAHVPVAKKPAPEPVQIAQNSPIPPPAYSPPQLAAVSVAQDAPAQQDSPAVTAQEQAPPPVRQPHVVTLPAGTNLMIRLGETISTDRNYSGDAFRGTLDAPVIMDGFIIADKGSKVLGKVVNADKGGHLTGTAELSLALMEIHTTDGQTVLIQTNTFEKKGPKNTASNAEKIGGGAALGAIIGAIAGGGKGAAIGAGAGGAAGTGVALATHGKGAVLPSETRLSFQLSTPVTITEKLN